MTLHLPVIAVMMTGVVWLSYNKSAVSDGRFLYHLFKAMFVHVLVKSPHSCQHRCISEIQVPVANEHRVLSRLDFHQIKDLFLCFLKILTLWDIRFGAARL